jgi:hypothetical protein
MRASSSNQISSGGARRQPVADFWDPQGKFALNASSAAATLRLKLLKIGARVTVSVRRIKLAMTSANPWHHERALAYARLAVAP